MAEPAGRRLRPARRSGLTSSEPVSTPTAPTAPPPPPPPPAPPPRRLTSSEPVSTPTAPTATRPPPPAQEPRTSRTTGERQDAHARIHLAKLLVQQSGRKRPAVIDRWIEA